MSNPSLDKNPSMVRHYLAIDLGAESGRVILGTLKSIRSDDASEPAEELALTELHRFANKPLQVGDSLKWDLASLFSEIKIGLKKAGELNLDIASMSTDAWGVDYVLLGDEGENENENEKSVATAFHYRDSRTDGVYEKVFPQVSADFIFGETGIQFMPINTLFQLFMEKKNAPEKLVQAKSLLNIGDYFNFRLSGKRVSEATLASTSQLYNPVTKDWSWALIEKLSLPKNIFSKVVAPGTELGPLQASVATETKLASIQIIATCSHDTAAAIAAIPYTSVRANESGPFSQSSSQESNWAFLSSGTWSLLGTELPSPKMNATCQRMNFTNEVGYNGTIMLRKNIVGLWILQECKRAWAEMGKDYSYEALTQMSSDAKGLTAFILPDDARFGKPGQMPQKILDYLKETGQSLSTESVSQAPGFMVRCILESLALLYAKTLEECEKISDRTFSILHLVGGGSRNEVLNQLTANATGLKVCAGPAEATAMGNILIQAKTLGHITGDLRNVVARSVETKNYLPHDTDVWKKAKHTFSKLPVLS